MEILLTLWLAASMPEGCAVTGQVIVTPEQTAHLLIIPAACPIRVERVGDVLFLIGLRWVVMVELPDVTGKYVFWYSWGSGYAFLGTGPSGQWLPVSYSPLLGA